MKASIRSVFIFSMLLLVLPLAVAQESPDRIVVNSEDWQDVYSATQFAALQGLPSHFLVSDRHATLLLNQLGKDEQIWIFSSQNFPHIIGYESLMNGRGYNAEEFDYESINLELADQLDSVNKYIIIDPSYGYNAVSVAPYAAATNSYVIFADEDNIGDVTDVLDGKSVESILIYGIVDREVRDALTQYNPDIINEEGDRFRNNVEIVRRFMEVKNVRQVLLTNGEFIEQEFMTGNEPVVFIGTNNVPDVTRDFIQKSDIEVGVLIGNELVGTATFIRRQVGISVFVKFAQGARAPQGRISQVEALDMFYLPTFTLNLEIESIRYNRASSQLEVTLRNPEDQSVYFTGTYSLVDGEGTRRTVGDEEPNFIDGNEIKTFVYDMEPLAEGELGGDVFIIFGESPGSLEKELRTSWDVDSVKILDSCEIQINAVALNLRKKQFEVELENVGQVECHADVEIIDMVIAGDKYTFSSEETVSLKPEQKKSSKVIVKTFEEEDLEDNEKVKVRVYYGERETSLIKIIEGQFELTVKSGDYASYTLIAIIIILLILIIWKRRKKKKHHHK